MSYFVRVLEYSAAARCARRFRKYNPSASPGLPIVRVINVGREKAADVDAGNFSELGPPGQYAKSVNKDYSGDLDKLVDALEYKANLIEDFRNDEWTVLNYPDARKYCVYVIRLEETARYTNKMRSANPGRSISGSLYYVGQTSKTPEERYLEHTEEDALGHRKSKLGSAFVFEHASRGADALVREIYEDWNEEPMTELESLMAERELAMQLRRLGHGVHYA